MGQRVDGSTGQTGHISTVYVGGPRNCLEGFFFEKVNRSTGQTGQTGQRVSGSNGSTGQQVTFTFTILYMIADDARLTPPRCKKHTAYDDTRLTPHHCKKHTASSARSTGKFPSCTNYTRNANTVCLLWWIFCFQKNSTRALSKIHGSVSCCNILWCTYKNLLCG